MFHSGSDRMGRRHVDDRCADDDEALAVSIAIRNVRSNSLLSTYEETGHGFVTAETRFEAPRSTASERRCLLTLLVKASVRSEELVLWGSS